MTKQAAVDGLTTPAEALARAFADRFAGRHDALDRIAAFCREHGVPFERGNAVSHG